MTNKEMRQAIKGWVAGIPGREWNKAIITSIGTKFVTEISLYDNGGTIKTPITDYYNELKGVIDNCIYQH